MKTLSTLLLLSLAISLHSQSEAIDEFYYNHGFADDMIKFKIGNGLIKMGSWFIEEPATRNLVRKSNRARFLISDNAHPVTRKAVDRLVRDIKGDGYESLAFVKDGMDKLEVYVKEDRNYIRNLLVVIHGEEEFLMASLDCRLTYDEIEAALNEEL